MRFQVPQFIEVEDKVVGPLTIKQFIFLAGGGGLSFLVYVLLHSLVLAIIPIVIIVSISAAFAFYRPNTVPFIDMVESAFKYYIGNHLYIWKKEDKKVAPVQSSLKAAQNYASVMVPKISSSKLKDLTWSLDIKESMYSKENQK